MSGAEEVRLLKTRRRTLELKIQKLRGEGGEERAGDAGRGAGKPKRRKMRVRGAETEPTQTLRPSLEIWTEEIRSLQDIFREALTCPEPVSSPPQALQILLRPHEGPTLYCFLTLSVQYRPGYPSQPALFSIVSATNVGKSDETSLVAQIQRMAEDRASLSTECIYDVCAVAIDMLSRVNEEHQKSRLSTQVETVNVRKTSLGDTDFSWKVRQDVASRKHRLEERSLPHNEDDKGLQEKLSTYHPVLEYDRSQSRFRDEFVSISEIGGSVFRAVDRIEAKEYAIKRIKLKSMSSVEIRKLTKEVVQLSELCHEHIVRYYYSWTEGKQDASTEDWDELPIEVPTPDTPTGADSDSSSDYDGSLSSEKPPYYLYIKMEFCDGDTLRALLDRDTLPEPPERWRIFREILDALSYMHGKQLLHRELKPANIFLDSEMRAKIGDFGLGTRARRKRKESEHSDTSPYSSPEAVVSDKSDLFSLGVIFFEMWRQFGSAVQRASELERLRSDRAFPEDFANAAPQNVIDVILELLQHRPEDRPTAKSMLASPLLPHHFDNQVVEDFITTILNPKTSERKWVLFDLFNKQTNPAEVDFSFSISKIAASGKETRQEDTRRLVKMQSLVQSSIVNRFKAIFEHAGAINIIAPLVTPYYDFVKIIQHMSPGHYELKKVKTEAVSRPATVTYMESTGILVSLPNNSLIPWARMISRKNLGGVVKRFSFSPIFEPRERQEPKQTLEASFDICSEEQTSSRAKALMEAEVVKVAYECMKCLDVQDIEVNITSSKILDAVMSILEVSKTIRTDVLQVLSNFHKKRAAVVKDELVKIGLSVVIIEKLAALMRLKGDITEIREQLRAKTGKDFQLLESELNSIEHLVNACVAFKIPKDILIVNLSVLSDGLLCYSGLMFTLADRSSSRQYSTGGRYDNLIRHYEFPDKDQSMFDSRPVRMSGVGVRIDLSRIVNLVLKHFSDGDKVPNCVVGPTVCVTSYSTCEEDTAKMLAERAAYCGELWKAGLAAIYYYLEVGEEQVVEYCSRYRIRFIVTLKYCEIEVLGREIRASCRDLHSKKSEDMKTKEELICYIQARRLQVSI